MDKSQAAHDNLSEIRDPVSRSKLTGIQESVWSIELEVKRARGAIEQKLGMAHAYKIAAERVFGRCFVLNKQLKDADLDAELAAETKLRVDEVKRATALLQELEREQQSDLVNLRGQIGGMERAIKALEVRFGAEASKVERWQRIEDEEKAERAELDTPPADKGNGSAGGSDPELETKVEPEPEAAELELDAKSDGSELDAKVEPEAENKPGAEIKPRDEKTDRVGRKEPATGRPSKKAKTEPWRRPK